MKGFKAEELETASKIVEKLGKYLAKWEQERSLVHDIALQYYKTGEALHLEEAFCLAFSEYLLQTARSVSKKGK